MTIANRQFQVTDPAAQQGLVQAQPLATLVVSHEGTLHVNHVPLYLDPSRGPHGTLSAVDDPVQLRAILHILSERHEAHRPDPWRIDDAPPDYIDKLLGAIVGIELAVERWEGIWKVSQNRTDTDRAGVVQGLMAEGTSAAEDMAALVLGRLMG